MMNSETVLFLFILSLPVAAISITVCKAKVFEPVRQRLAEQNAWLGKLMNCPYCTSHWVALAAVIVYRPAVFESALWPVDLAVSVFAIVSLSTPVSWAIYRSYTGLVETGNEEMQLLRNALVKAKAKIEEQDRTIKEMLKAKQQG